MVCATFGHQALAPHARGFSIFNALLTLIAGVFCILGCISNTNNEVSIFALPWVIFSVPPPVAGGVTQYSSFGLRGFIVYVLSGDGTPVYVPSSFILSNPGCPAPLYPLVTTFAECANTACVPVDDLVNVYCTKCNTAGQGVIATLVISLLLAFLSFAGFLFRCCCDGTCWKDITVFGSIGAFGMGVASYSIAGPCKSAVEAFALKELPTGFTSGYGKGAALVAASWSLVLSVSVVALMVPVPQAPKEAKDKSAGLANKK